MCSRPSSVWKRVQNELNEQDQNWKSKQIGDETNNGYVRVLSFSSENQFGIRWPILNENSATHAR